MAEKLGGKDGCGNVYPSSKSISDLSYQPGAPGKGHGAKDGAGSVYGDAKNITELSSQPFAESDGLGGKSRGHEKAGSLKRMEDDVDGYSSEDRRFRKGKG